MACGILQGASESLYDLNALRDELFQGGISASWANDDGELLLADDGKQLLAERSLIADSRAYAAEAIKTATADHLAVD